MKKLLGVSIAAMLAVSPMMANAAQTAGKLNAAAAGTASTKIATTTYVKGAYKALADAHDKVVDDITVGAKAEGNYKAIVAGDSVADNLKKLDQAIANLDTSGSTTYQTISDSTVANGYSSGTNGDHITSGNNVGANLVSLNTAVKANDSAISTLNGSGSGSVAKSIQDNAQSATFTAAANSDLSNGTLASAIEAVNAKVNTANQNATLGAGNYYSAGANVNTAIAAVDSQAHTNAGNIATNAGNIATNAADIADLKDVEIDLYGDWGSDTKTGSVTLGSLIPQSGE